MSARGDEVPWRQPQTVPELDRTDSHQRRVAAGARGHRALEGGPPNNRSPSPRWAPRRHDAAVTAAGPHWTPARGAQHRRRTREVMLRSPRAHRPRDIPAPWSARDGMPITLWTMVSGAVPRGPAADVRAPDHRAAPGEHPAERSGSTIVRRTPSAWVGAITGTSAEPRLVRSPPALAALHIRPSHPQTPRWTHILVRRRAGGGLPPGVLNIVLAARSRLDAGAPTTA